MSTKFRPMLAASVEPSQLQNLIDRYNFLIVSRKFDGIRALVRDGIVLTRSLKPVPNKHVQSIFGRPEFEGFDGELVSGPIGQFNSPDVFSRTTSNVMSIEGQPEVWFFVFDTTAHQGGYRERWQTLKSAEDCYRTIRVPEICCYSVNSILEYEERILGKGGEGIMLRAPDAPYKFGRSTLVDCALLKLKRFADGEARILDFVPKYKNNNPPALNALGLTERATVQANKVALDTLGAFLVEDTVTGVQFEIGTGLNDWDRTHIWQDREQWRGKILKYKHFPTGAKDKPRFPVFLGFRDERDM